MYSQSNEEPIITEHFGAHVGRALDCGAYDGACFSNSLRLIELGWSAICVEPSPGACRALIDRHRTNPRVEIVNAAIVPAPTGLMKFHDSPDAVATLSEAHHETWKELGQYRPIWIQPITTDQLLAQFGHDFDAVLIDIEGTNLEVLQSFPWAEMKATRLVCVEYETHAEEMEALLSPHGFKQLAINGENLILAR